MNKPFDQYADIQQPMENIPLDFLPEIEDHSNPLYLVEELEQETIELFGVNLNGRTVK